MTALAPTVEEFFTQQLAVQRDAGPHTVAADRETLRLCWSSSATAPHTALPARRRRHRRHAGRGVPHRSGNPGAPTACPPATTRSPPSIPSSVTPPCAVP